jgi:hypothetical protein
MQISEDYFLIRVAAIIVPAFALLIGSMIISLLVIKRYSRAVKRLYQMNFHGVETESIMLPESWTRSLVKKSLNLTKRYDQTNPTQIHA